MVRYVFWTGSEYEIMRNLANFKICLIFCLGGLGSCSRTVRPHILEISIFYVLVL